MIRDVNGTALVLYAGKIPADGKPTKSQTNCITRLCRNGSIKSAFKVGNRWFTDIEAERGLSDGDD